MTGAARERDGAGAAGHPPRIHSQSAARGPGPSPLSRSLHFLMRAMRRRLTPGLAGGLNGITYVTVSQEAGTRQSHPTSAPVPLPRIPAGSSASPGDAGQACSPGGLLHGLFVCTVERLEALCFDWQEPLTGLVPGERFPKKLNDAPAWPSNPMEICVGFCFPTT